MKQNVIATILFFSLVANIFGLWVIVMQDDVIAQKEYDLNVSQTAFKIQSAQIARGLCLPVLEIR